MTTMPIPMPTTADDRADPTADDRANSTADERDCYQNEGGTNTIEAPASAAVTKTKERPTRSKRRRARYSNEGETNTIKAPASAAVTQTKERPARSKRWRVAPVRRPLGRRLAAEVGLEPVLDLLVGRVDLFDVFRVDERRG